VAPASDATQTQANRKGKLLKLIYQHDWLYWLASKLFRRQVLALMGVSGEVISRLTPPQRKEIDRLIDFMNPVEPRSAGVTFDNATPLPGPRIAAIRAPTLIIHARDDSLQLYRNAEFAEAMIPEARLVSFDDGGHVVTLVKQMEIRALVQRHLRDHATLTPDPNRTFP
jgi:pimeloyl-ACP methyl ester carboxylesterase